MYHERVDHRWDVCTAQSLRGHLVNDHLRPNILLSMGVARYDIELAKYRGFDLDWVVKRSLLRLERTDQEIGEEIQSELIMAALRFSPQQYRRMLVKNLLYIAQLELSDVPWGRVTELCPNHPTRLNLSRDSCDISLDDFLQGLRKK